MGVPVDEGKRKGIQQLVNEVAAENLQAREGEDLHQEAQDTDQSDQHRSPEDNSGMAHTRDSPLASSRF